MKTPEERAAQLAAEWHDPASIHENPMNLMTEMERLAALVADHIRAAVAEALALADQDKDRAVAGEREACAKVVDYVAVYFWGESETEKDRSHYAAEAMESLAAAIRGRGEGEGDGST